MSIAKRFEITSTIVGIALAAAMASHSAGSGCAASDQHMKTVLPLTPVAARSSDVGPLSSQPAPDLTALVSQQSGAVNALATATAKLAATVDTRVNASATGVGGDVAGYRSEFGMGAVAAVALSMLTALGLVWIVIRNSHMRELKRIESKRIGA